MDSKREKEQHIILMAIRHISGNGKTEDFTEKVNYTTWMEIWSIAENGKTEIMLHNFCQKNGNILEIRTTCGPP